MKKVILPTLILSIILLLLTFGCATTSGVQETSRDDVAVITDIQILDNQIVIVSNKKFTYTIYSSIDPYKTTIEIPDMKTGGFNSRISSDKSGITEVNPQQINSPKTAVRIDMVLQNPSTVIPSYEDKSLTLLIMTDKSSKKIEKPVAVSESAGNPSGMVSAKSTPPMSEATEINDIKLEKTYDTVKIVVTGNGAMMPNVFPLDDRIVVDIPDVSLNASLPEDVVSPIRALRAGKHSDKVRLVIDLKRETNYDVAAVGNSIIVALQKSIPASAQMPDTHVKKSDKITQTVSDPGQTYMGDASVKRISLDFQDADIRPIFRLLADVKGYNLVLDPSVSGNITIKLMDVPWGQALDIILNTFNLDKSIGFRVHSVVKF